MPEFTPAEQDRQSEQRILSDAELLKDGAGVEEGVLRPTADQVANLAVEGSKGTDESLDILAHRRNLDFKRKALGSHFLGWAAIPEVAHANLKTLFGENAPSTEEEATQAMARLDQADHRLTEIEKYLALNSQIKSIDLTIPRNPDDRLDQGWRFAGTTENGGVEVEKTEGDQILSKVVSLDTLRKHNS